MCVCVLLDHTRLCHSHIYTLLFTPPSIAMHRFNSKLIRVLFFLKDEGWQMGKIEGTDKVGVFPENFTKKL